MANNLTDSAENAALDFTLGNTATPPTGPMKVALVTVAGSDSAAGTEATGGSYARLTMTFTASSGGASSNATDLLWEGMPAGTFVGAEVWDSAVPPVRWWYGPLVEDEILKAGDDLKIASGSLDISFS